MTNTNTTATDTALILTAWRLAGHYACGHDLSSLSARIAGDHEEPDGIRDALIAALERRSKHVTGTHEFYLWGIIDIDGEEVLWRVTRDDEAEWCLLARWKL